MSPTDTIREAAEGLRAEWGAGMAVGTAWNGVRDFHLAVADLLDSVARADDAMQRQLRAMGKRGHAYGYDEALAAARAYLGRES